MSRKPYSLFKRNNSKSWYCRFRLPDGSTKDLSTGCSRKKDAENWAFETAKKEAHLIKSPRITLFEFSGPDFFAWDNNYCQSRRATGKRLNEEQAAAKTSELRRYILPYFGKLPLLQITEPAIEKFRNKLLLDDQKSGSTVNKILSSLHAVLKQAKREGFIQFVPEVEKACCTPKKSKGVLTPEEVKRLFANEDNFHTFTSYCANILACHTGLRLGEVLGIQLKNVNAAGYIEIEKSFNTRLQKLNSTTKSGKVRRVVIPPNVQEILQKLYEENPYKQPDSFLFYSPIHLDRPIHAASITGGLYSALEKIGITQEERRLRGVSFHSFRYFANSLFIAGNIPLIQVQAMTGHLTDSMSAHYFSAQLEQMDGIRKLQETILQ